METGMQVKRVFHTAAPYFPGGIDLPVVGLIAAGEGRRIFSAPARVAYGKSAPAV